MVIKNIDISQKLLKRFGNELHELNKLLFNSLDIVIKLQVTWEALAEELEGSTEH
jgi:hypothetical protein